MKYSIIILITIYKLFKGQETATGSKFLHVLCLIKVLLRWAVESTLWHAKKPNEYGAVFNWKKSTISRQWSAVIPH